jgi:hypothetical protein
MLFAPFNSYTVHNAFGKDLTVKQLEDRYFAYDIDFPVGADETAIARMEWLNKL